MLDRELGLEEMESWLRETDSVKLEALWSAADRVRKANVGEEVHLRGLVEISNHCARQCLYCGLRAGRDGVARYRMDAEEIMQCALEAVEYGYGTVVLQAGEDYGIGRDWLGEIVRRIKAETPLAVTLSMGERPDEDLIAWRRAGADRYLLRFETGDMVLYRAIHPDPPGRISDRLAILKTLRDLGYEVGSGVLVGIPGQTFTSLAGDIDTFGRLDLDMIGVGPFLPHPATPLGQMDWEPAVKVRDEDQVPNDEWTTYKVIALTRIVRPDANIPSTTALATVHRESGRELGWMRGANVVMPNLTPRKYRALYEIYPGKVCVDEDAQACRACLLQRIASTGRVPGRGQGGRRRKQDSRDAFPVPAPRPHAG